MTYDIKFSHVMAALLYIQCEVQWENKLVEHAATL